MKRTIILIGFLLLLSPLPGSAQQQNCDDVRQKSGAAAYRLCLFNNEEDRIRSQVTSYKNLIDINKATARMKYDSLTNEENYRWNTADIALQREIADHQSRITQFGSAPENAEQKQAEQNALNRAQKIRSLTSSVHANTIRRLHQQRDGALADLDSAVNEYELQLRQQCSY